MRFYKVVVLESAFLDVILRREVTDLRVVENVVSAESVDERHHELFRGAQSGEAELRQICH